MSFNELLLILKARKNVIAMTFGAVVLLALVVSLILPKTYEASTSLLLNYKGMDPVTGDILPSQLMPGYIATQIDVITSRNVAIRVVEKLQLDTYPEFQEQFKAATNEGEIKIWIADKLIKDLIVRPSKKSSVIDIVYRGVDPKFVTIVANTFAESYEEANIQLKVQPAKQAAVFLGVQIAALKKRLASAQSNLSIYQQERGITNVDGGNGVETTKLNELSSQLVIAQAQLYDSKSRKRSTSDHSPDIASNPLVQNLKVDVARAKSKLKELSKKYGASHPLYIAAKAELDEQELTLQAEIKSASGNIKETYNIYQNRVNEINAAVAKQKEKVLKLNLNRDELTVLQREVVNAQKSMDTASQRFNATLQAASSNQSDLTVLNPARTPFLPSNPKIKLNLLIAAVLGLLLGITFAFIAEMKDKRIRSKDDLYKLLDMQIFSISNDEKEVNAVAPNNPSKLIKFT